MQGTLQFRRLLILESCHISKVANGDDFFVPHMKKLTICNQYSKEFQKSNYNSVFFWPHNWPRVPSNNLFFLRKVALLKFYSFLCFFTKKP
ncbi:hypothetical protein D3C87_230870 [compost metagenome]